MPARLTAYLPEQAAAEFYLATGASARVGRTPGNEITLAHPSVSRAHACLEPVRSSWRLRDLGSKNGSTANGESPTDEPLGEHAWLRFGDVTCEFRLLDEATHARALAERGQRQQASAVYQRRLEQSRALPDLLRATLAAVVELAGCERGFLLVMGPDGPEVRAWQGLDASELAAPAFAGSAGAVEQALRERRAVVLNDASQDACLGARASVLAGGIRALVCLPLAVGPEALGLAYADSRQPGRAITALDLELLSAFAERAALWLAARRSELQLADASRAAWPRQGSPAAGGHR